MGRHKIEHLELCVADVAATVTSYPDVVELV